MLSCRFVREKPEKVKCSGIDKFSFVLEHKKSYNKATQKQQKCFLNLTMEKERERNPYKTKDVRISS